MNRSVERKTTDRRVFSSESVTEGHPDKLADQISDAVLDAALREDPHSRVACETLVTTGLVHITGEVTTRGFLDTEGIARQTLRRAGYTSEDYGIHPDRCKVLRTLDEQSTEIGQGVDGGGAGDQGMMFGYATDEGSGLGIDLALMPVPIMLAHRLTRRLAEARGSGEVEWLRPDGKAQVSVEYIGDRPVSIDRVVVAAQHHPPGIELAGGAELTDAAIRQTILEKIVLRALSPTGIYDQDRADVIINGTGVFVEGGPKADAGLTGRKIIVDTYGGAARHGGGAFSGKDATKVDRSGAYAARWIAKNVVAAGLASKVEIQVAYAIGKRDPVSLLVDSFGTATTEGTKARSPDEVLQEKVDAVFDLRPQAIKDSLGLAKPIYFPTATYGHFGRKAEGDQFPWERTDMVDELLK